MRIDPSDCADDQLLPLFLDLLLEGLSQRGGELAAGLVQRIFPAWLHAAAEHTHAVNVNPVLVEEDTIVSPQI